MKWRHAVSQPQIFSQASESLGKKLDYSTAGRELR